MISKEELLTRKLRAETVPLPSGDEVRVRGLTRAEALRTAECEDTAEMEVMGLHLGMLEPSLTLDEAKQWQREGLAADVQAAARRISELSNMDPSGGKGPTSRSRRTRN
jgi:hypothetical protein